MNEAGTYNLSIEGLIPDIHKIDEKYLPNSVKIGKPGTGAYAEIFNNYYQNVASGVYSHAEGRATIASGQSAHAEGEYSTASQMGSHAEGGGTASGQFSHAEGIGTALGNYSHAEGSGTRAIGIQSHAEGLHTIASGNSSHAEGQGYYTFITLSGEASATTYNITGTINEKIQVGSIIENNNRTALATITAIDKENLTVTLSKSISSEILNEKKCWVYCNEIASGDYSHVEGQQTIASGSQSHAEGLGTVASGESQHVHGSYNLSDTTSAHIVGNGTSDTSRSNAHTLGWDGNAWYAGDVYVGSTSGTNKDEGSKKLATESYVNEKIETIGAPVNSVNGHTGDIVLTASDVGALPDTTEIPSIDGLASESYVDTAIGNIEIPSIEGLASENYVETKIAELVNSAPETLNTLNELATALGNDPNFATTIATEIGTKANAAS